MPSKIDFQKFPGAYECESNSESIGPQYDGADSNVGIQGLLRVNADMPLSKILHIPKGMSDRLQSKLS